MGDGEALDPTSGVRDASRWLTAAGGLIATAAVAGLQLSSLSSARWPWIALLAFALAFLAAAAVVFAATAVLLPAYGTLGDLRKREDAASRSSKDVRLPTANKSLLLRYGYVDPLFRHLYESGFRNTPSQMLELGTTSDAPGEATTTTVEHVAAVAGQDRMLLVIDAFQARARFKTLRRTAAVSGAVLLVAIPLFALSATKSVRSPAITQPLGVTVAFQSLPAALGSDCDITSPLNGVIVGGMLHEPLVAFPAQRTCDASLVDVTEEMGLAVPVPPGS